MDHYINALKLNGLKITPRRKAIIEIFIACGIHLTPEQVWSQLCRRFKRCGLPSVYRNLESMTDCGVLTRIQLFDRNKHYALCSARPDDHHHHLTCTSCGKIEELDICPINGKRYIKGFKVISHFVQVNGICKDCQKSERSYDDVK